jgi:lysophospholipase L1-like esterase
MKIRLLLAFTIMLATAVAHGENRRWIASWSAAPLPPGPAMGPFPATPSFADQTIRQIVRLSAGGTRIRLRLTNEYGTKPLLIGAAYVALANADGSVQAGKGQPVSFGGKPTTTIPAGSPLLSDPIDLPAKPLSSLSISIFLPEDTGPCTCHATGLQTAYISELGDFTNKIFTPSRTMQFRAFLSGIEVQTSMAAKTIVVLGDSISDGIGSTVDANRRWPDLLAERLTRSDRSKAWGVVNLGISGNRVLNDGAGVSALARFDRDVLAVPGAAYVIIFEGINDIGISYGHFEGPMAAVFQSLVPAHKPTAEALIAGYRQLIERAHAKGMKAYGATIAPFDGAAYYSSEGEAVRQEVNSWIRSGGGFDAVLDFDAILRDAARPTRLADAFQSGDHLHGSDAGYQAFASSINLSLFR